MKRGVNVVIPMFIASSVAVVLGAGFARADPTVPQPGVACGGSAGVMDGAQTFSPQHEVLQCVKGIPMFVWQHLDDIQRPATAWFTYGPPATLNRGDVVAGSKWTAYARGSDCTAEQTRVAGGAQAVQAINGTDTSDFTVLPDMATLTLHGVCIWRQVGS